MTKGPQPRPLPVLADSPFTYGRALEEGATARRMRARDLDARVYGVRAPAGSADDFVRRCAMFATRLAPGVFFSHSTAARLLGIPLPLSVLREEALHATVAAPARAPHAAGLRGHSRVIVERDVVTSGGVAHSSPTRVFCELGGVLALHDLVAVVDFLIRRDLPLCSVADLAARIEVGDRITRRRILRAALERADERSESRPKTLLRLILADAGLPRPSINHELVDTESGRRLRTDFAYPELRFAIEYQGDGHRTRAQWRADMTRRSRLEAMGWYVMELNADDLQNPAELVSRIRAVLRRRQRLLAAHLPDFVG